MQLLDKQTYLLLLLNLERIFIFYMGFEKGYTNVSVHPFPLNSLLESKIAPCSLFDTVDPC